LILWLFGAVLFVAPLAIAVAALTVKYPGAGGLYLWTRCDFGPWQGFLCFWTYWMSIVFWFPNTAMVYMSMTVYALGPGYAHLADNRIYMVLSSLATIWLALGTNLVGLRVGKWTENLGGAAVWILGAALVILAVLVTRHRGSATPFDLIPRWDWQTVSLCASIAYAMTGMELVGMMGGEIRNPRHTLPRAAVIASVFAVVFYVSATASLLALLPPARINDRYGLAQGGQEAATVLGANWLPPVIAVLVVVCATGLIGGIVSGRLPSSVCRGRGSFAARRIPG
jgi:APA family basic amino acid/polyamine antiporter